MKIIKFYNIHLIQLLCVSIIIICTCISFMGIIDVMAVAAAEAAVATPRVRCETPDMIPNGSYRLRRNNMIMRVSCNIGFQLQGYRLISCIRGKWYEEKPVCAKKGCTEILKSPENGRIHIQNDIKGILYCLDDYTLAGNRVTFCNGTHWDRPIGNCRLRKNTVQHFCDFETDDVCGWVYEPHDGLEWKRVMAARVFRSFRTGPRYDHTTHTANGGHYMLMESLTRQSTLVTLTSPIYKKELSLKTACCFQFYYFMYGSGVGTLYVIVKPTSISSVNDILRDRKDLIKFQKTGNQNNLWNEAYFNIEELDEDFQIVFAAKGGLGHLSDIAIDDVHLMTGQQCKTFDNIFSDYSTTAVEQAPTTAEPYESIYDTQSCVGRCNDTKNTKGIMFIDNHLIELCSCSPECEEFDSCCPDFKSVCLNDIFMEPTSTELTPFFTGREIMSDEVIPSMFEQSDNQASAQASVMNTFNTNRTTSIPVTFTTNTNRFGWITQVPSKNTTNSNIIPMIIPHITTSTVTLPMANSTASTVKPSSTIHFNATREITTTIRTVTVQKPTTTQVILPPTTTATTTTKTTTVATRKTTLKQEIEKIGITLPRFTLPTTSTMSTLKPTTTTIRITTTTATTPNEKTTSIVHKTTAPLRRTTLPILLRPLSNNSTVKKESISTFIINADTQMYPDDFQSHSTSVYCILIFIVLIVIIMLIYRTCGGHAVAWYRIYFRKHESNDGEISSLNDHLISDTSLEQSPILSLSQRCLPKDIYSKVKLQKWRRRSNGKDDMKMPLWKTISNHGDNDDDDDDDGGDDNENDKNVNGNIHTTSLNNKLFTEL